IVTGAGGGIGLAVARMFARGGANVLITGRRQQQLEKVASQERGIEPFVADAGSPDDASRTVEKAVQLWHRLDVLVNNAGAGMPSALVDVTDESLGTVYRINTIGPTLLAAAAVPHLAKTRGTI